jgi:hypothetical protein
VKCERVDSYFVVLYRKMKLIYTLIEDYTKIYYMFDRGDILFIQCKIKLKGPKSMRKVENLSLTLSDFYVPARTLRLNSTKSSL